MPVLLTLARAGACAALAVWLAHLGLAALIAAQLDFGGPF